ncbi:UNVERIFIED_ORG: hypothetical protein BDK47_11669 [Anoxybacillus amylolyticus]
MSKNYFLFVFNHIMLITEKESGVLTYKEKCREGMGMETIVYKNVEFQNVEWLLSFLRNHLNDSLRKHLEEDPAVLYRFLDEIMLEESSYELRSHQTKSKHAEVIRFQREDILDEETWDIVKTIITF